MRGALVLANVYFTYMLCTRTAYLPPPVQNVCAPMTSHEAATHGERRSPTRAAFQNNPRKPVLCESINCGAFILTYVQVQMNSRIVTRKDLGGKVWEVCQCVVVTVQCYA